MGFFSDQAGGSGTPTASWKVHQCGDMVVGTIVETSVGKAFEYAKDGKGKAKVGADGNPIPKLTIVLDTGKPDNYASATKVLTDENGQVVPDDGRRAVHAEKGTNISFAIARALQEHDMDDVEVGGQLWVRYTEDGTSNSGFTFRIYEAGYKPAPKTSGFGFADQQQAPQQQQQYAPPPQPQQQYAPPPQAPVAPPQAPPAQQAPPPYPQADNPPPF
jgi:hypothetical protein